MGAYRALGWFRWVNSSTKQIALEALERVGMAAYADRQISQLSGGQQQRVFLARALVQEADLFFLDEPFAAVDAATERAIVELLRDLRKRGASCLVVHHDLATVPQYFDWIVLLNKRVTVCGPVEKAFTKANVCETYGGNIAFLGRLPRHWQEMFDGAVLWEVLSLRDYNTRLVILCSLLLGAACGPMGAYFLLRRRSLMGDVLSHATLPGVALAFLLSVWLGVGNHCRCSSRGQRLPVC